MERTTTPGPNRPGHTLRTAATLVLAAALGAAGCPGPGATGSRGTSARDRSALYADREAVPHLPGGGFGGGDEGTGVRALVRSPDPAILALTPDGPDRGFPRGLGEARARWKDLKRTLADSPRTYRLGELPVAAASNLDLLLGATRSELNPFAAVRAGKHGKELYLARPTGDAEETFDKALAAFKADRIADATKGFEAVLEAHPDLPRALLHMGELFEKSGGTDKARALYERAVAANPIDAEAHHRLAALLLTLDRTEEAHAQILEALLYNPRYAWAWARLGELAKGEDVASPRFEPPILLELLRTGEVQVAWGEWSDGPAEPYALCKAAMRYEIDFWSHVTGLSGPYRLSVMEELACVRILLAAYVDDRDAGRSGRRVAYMERLLEVEAAGMLRQFVLFDVFGYRAPHRMALLPDDDLDKIRTYLERFALTRPTDSVDAMLTPPGYAAPR